MITFSPKVLWHGGVRLSCRYIVIALLLGGATCALAQEAAVYSIDDVRIGRSDGRTRVVFDISGPASYSVEQLPDPHRLRLELADTARASADREPALTGTPVSSMGFTRGQDGILRIVLEFDSAVRYEVFSLKPYAGRGDRLVLDIYPGPAVREPRQQREFGKTQAIAAASAGQAAGVVAEPAGGRPVARVAKASDDSPAFRFSGTWEQEGAIETDDSDTQKFEALVEPRLDIYLAADTDITAIARVRLDSVGDLGPYQHKPDNYSDLNGPWYNRGRAELSLRELYLDTRWGDTYWRLGKQQVVWGQADGIKVLDVVNPQSFREYILDDFDVSRIPLYMAKMEAPLGSELTLQLLWIPDTSFHELAEEGTPYYLTSPLLVPVAPPGLDVSLEKPDVPDDYFDDSDIGGRLSGFVGGWDFTLNYLYRYQDFPVLYQRLDLTADGARGVVSPVYERSHTSGGTLSNAFGDFTVRTELAYDSDTYHVATDLARLGIEKSSELASVLGLDWQLGQYDTLLSAQWFQSHLFDYRSSINRDETEQYLSLYFQRTFAQETWTFDTLALYSLNHQDSLAQAKLKYFWRSNLEVWVGADVFLGDREGVFGQFRDQSRLLLGFQLGF